VHYDTSTSSYNRSHIYEPWQHKHTILFYNYQSGLLLVNLRSVNFAEAHGCDTQQADLWALPWYIVSGRMKSEHLQRLQMMFDRWHSHFARTAAFLGNMISANKSKMQEENISAVRDTPRGGHYIKSEISWAIAHTTASSSPGLQLLQELHASNKVEATLSNAALTHMYAALTLLSFSTTM